MKLRTVCRPLAILFDFRQFVRTKTVLYLVINGEKATFNTPTFAKKRERTLDMLIKDLYSDYMSDSSKVVSYLNYCCTQSVLFPTETAINIINASQTVLRRIDDDDDIFLLPITTAVTRRECRADFHD